MNRSISRRLIHLVAFLAVALTAGCAEMVTVRTHEPIDLKAIGTTLRVGESTREDVIAALGVPAGRGRAMLPIDEEPRTVWFYTYSVASAPMAGGKGKLDVMVVFVYFKGDRYDGSMYGSAFTK
jgi:hypothetical protein